MEILRELLNSLIFFLIVIDPLVVVPVFLGMTRLDRHEQRCRTAKRASLIALVVLVGFAFIGEKFLDILTISTPALQLAGGLLLLMMAIEIVMAKPQSPTSTAQNKDQEATPQSDPAVFPLAIPLIAGPGAMTAVVMRMREVPQDPFLQGGILLMVVVAVGVTYVCLRLAEDLTQLLGVTGANVLARVFGIILAALAVQFMLNGLVAVVKGI